MIKLTKEQQAAVSSATNPTTIIAGAGAGKTTTMIAYVKAIAGEPSMREYAKIHVAPEKIMAVSFTNDNADHFKEKLAEAKYEPLKKVKTSTIDSLATNLLTYYAKMLPRKPEVNSDLTSIMTASQYFTFIQQSKPELIAKYPEVLHNWRRFIQFIYSYDKYGDPDNQVFNDCYRNIMHEFNTYQIEHLPELTYTLDSIYDLLNQVIDKVAYTIPFNLLIIDESQDLNQAQLSLITTLFKHFGKLPSNHPQHLHLALIGDPSQSIFRFNGSDPQGLMNFIKEQQVAPLTLTHNFRSYQDTLTGGNMLLKTNFDNAMNMQLISNVGDHAKNSGISFLKPSSRSGQIQQTANIITKLVREQGVPPEKIAYLCRSGLFNHYDDRKSKAEQLTMLLKEQNINVINTQIGQQQNQLSYRLKKALAILESYQWAIDHPNDHSLAHNPEIYLLHLTTTIYSKKQLAGLPKIQGDHQANDPNSYVNVNQLAFELNEFLNGSQVRLDPVDRARLVNSQAGSQLHLSNLQKIKDSRYNQKIWAKALHNALTLYMTIIRQVVINQDETHGVTLTSIHDAKGSEWDYVFVEPENAGYWYMNAQTFKEQKATLDYTYDLVKEGCKLKFRPTLTDLKRRIASSKSNDQWQYIFRKWQDQQDLAYVALTRARVHTFVLTQKQTREIIRGFELNTQNGLPEERQKVFQTIAPETLLYSGYWWDGKQLYDLYLNGLSQQKSIFDSWL